jgi:capsular polysaccharide biosynthesis protein
VIPRYVVVALRGSVVAGLVAAIAVGAIVLTYVGKKPVMYEARFTLVARAAKTSGPDQVDLASLASLTMPSLTDLARSPTVLEDVVQRVNSTSSVQDLAEHIGVELVPASGVARISVRAATPTLATDLAQALSGKLTQLRLLAPAGRLQVYGPETSGVRKVSPDGRLSVGFALLAAISVALMVGFAVLSSKKTILSRRQAAAIVKRHDMAVVRFRGGGSHLSADIFVEVLPAGRSAADAAKVVEAGLRQRVRSEVVRGRCAARSIKLLVVALGRTTTEELADNVDLLAMAEDRVIVLLVAEPGLVRLEHLGGRGRRAGSASQS